ncbi:MAG: 1-acyl-sn-glycerol-3-phosphate acyltransferase [Epsilonproteobacteria bacterium]|nr:MAG: 1-acyl-sn-glycerol-3-phosphate acyltransferase [Campylobacterota bacterium]
MKIFAKIRFYWDAFLISFIVAVIMIPLLALFPSKKGTTIHRLNMFIIFLIGGKLIQIGEADPEADMILMNHQGIVDIIGMEALQTGHLRWIAKKELFDTPWFGHLLRKGDMISIDRENKTGLLKLIKDVKESQTIKHRAVALFPEGTRADGQELLSFKSGAKFIAKKIGLKVQPVVITGSKYLLNEHNRTAHNSTVHYIYLPTIDVKNAPDDWYNTMKTSMQKVIDDELDHASRSR